MKNRQGKQALRSFVSFWAGCLPLLSPDPLASPCSSYSVPPETDPCGPPQRLLGPLASGSGSSGEHGKEEGSEVGELVSGTPSGGVTDLSAQLWPPATHGCSPPPHQPQLSLPWKLHCPCGFPRAHLYFAKSLSLDLPQITLI